MIRTPWTAAFVGLLMCVAVASCSISGRGGIELVADELAVQLEEWITSALGAVELTSSFSPESCNLPGGEKRVVKVWASARDVESAEQQLISYLTTDLGGTVTVQGLLPHRTTIDIGGAKYLVTAEEFGLELSTRTKCFR